MRNYYQWERRQDRCVAAGFILQAALILAMGILCTCASLSVSPAGIDCSNTFDPAECWADHAD